MEVDGFSLRLRGEVEVEGCSLRLRNGVRLRGRLRGVG